MANPQLVVEIAFGYTWQSATPAWTDVSSYVRAANWTKGRSNELDTFSAATATVVLDNRTRRFDPLYSSGAYYGNLKPMVPIRIRAYHNSTYYDRFYGYVEGFPQQYDRGNTDATCTITATDAFKVLQNITLPSAYETVILADTPKLYWKLGEQDGSVAADSSGNRYDGIYTNNVVRAQTSLVNYSGDAAAGFTGLNVQLITGPSGSRVDTYPLTVEGWWNATTPSSTNQRPLVWQNGGSSGTVHCNLAIGYDSASDIFIILYTYSSTGPIDIIKSWVCSNAYDGQTHHFMCVVDDLVDDCKLYVDGQELQQRATATGNPGVAATGGWNVGAYSEYFTTFNGSIDDVAVYSSALTAADALAHYQAGTAPYTLELTGTRIGRVLDLIGWPAALRNIDAGEALVGPFNCVGRSALDYLQAIAVTEQGRLFVDGDGKITFHAKDRFITQSTESSVQATFSDDGADNPYAELSFQYGDTFIYNDALVSRDGGVAQGASNSTSQTAYGKRTKSIGGLLLADDRASRAVADYLVFRYQDPQFRVEQFQVMPTTTGQWTAVLALKIGYRINVERTPQATGSAIDFDVHVESITESVTTDEWLIELTASPADTNSYLIWGTGTWGSSAWR